MRSHALGDAMPNGPDPDIHPFECATELFNQRQVCIVTHGVRSRQALFGLTRANHIDTVELGFPLERLDTALLVKASRIQSDLEVFGHFVVV